MMHPLLHAFLAICCIVLLEFSARLDSVTEAGELAFHLFGIALALATCVCPA